MAHLGSDAMRPLGVTPLHSKHFSQMQVNEQLTVEQAGILAQRTVESTVPAAADSPYLEEFLVGFRGNQGVFAPGAGPVTAPEGITTITPTASTLTITLPNGVVDGQLVAVHNGTGITATTIDYKEIGTVANVQVTVTAATTRALFIWYTDIQDSGWVQIL